MILTVTPNPALDLTWRVERLIPGATHRADAGAARAGGKGLNVARVLHAQGASTLALTTAGGRSGIAFSTELAESGVPHRVVPVTAPTRQSIAIVDEELGDTTIINERGENPADAEWAALFAEVVDALPSAEVLVVSGSLPPGAPDTFVPLLIGTARDAGVPTVVDTSGPALLHAADAGASVLKPNAAELVEATGIADPIDGARSLIARGVELVLLSLGADGMLAVTASEVLHARLDAPLAGNPTGAGDAGVAACALLYADGERDPATVLRRATSWSAAAVLVPLAGEISDSWRALDDRLVVGAYAPAPREESP